jgi:asparagine synthase (glutamine-hydrolysing)
VTLRFPRCEESHESNWQEQVVAHLGLDDWLRRDFVDEIDVVGPYATRILRRHGLLWPFNAYFHAPIAEAAVGGSVLTGLGGDELMLPSTHRRVAMLLGRKTRPRWRDVPQVAKAIAPRPVRRLLHERDYRARPALPWLRADAQREVAQLFAREAVSQPINWDSWIRRYWWHCRYRTTACGSLDRVIVDAGAMLAVHPLCDPEFLARISTERGQLGFRNRTQAMEALFGDLLPQSILSRTSKSMFNTAMWEHHARSFDVQWDGTGVDDTIVDVAALRREWSSDRPDARSFLLAQQAWLDRYARSGAQASD